MRYLLFITLISLPVILDGQKLYAPPGAEWKYEGHSLDCTGYHQRFAVEAEIEVQGRDCSVIRGYLWTTETNGWEYQDSLVVWEDAGKVYFLEDTSFYLIYDFSAESGDTISIYYPVGRKLFSTTRIEPGQTEPLALTYSVEDVSETEIDGQIRKVFQLTQVYDTVIGDYVEFGEIIVGIGSTTMGILGEACCYLAKGCFGQIVCYSNEMIDYASGYLNCDFTSASEDIRANSLVVYPNPAHGFLTITQHNDLNFNTISICDISGRILTTGVFESHIDISGLSPGVYFLKMTTNQCEQLISKFVVR